MATTRIMPMHVIKGQSLAKTIQKRLGYTMDQAKTDHGVLIASFGCDPKTAAAEMLLCKRQYESAAGQTDEKRSDIALYQIRQSFKPGEVTPQQALEIGKELAARFTGNKYQYIVATHTDKAHIHNHIIFNSTAIDGSRKFRNFYGSSQALRRLSDLICIENGLSVIERPQQKHKDYGSWMGSRKYFSKRDLLRHAIDEALDQQPASFVEFFELLKVAGYEVRVKPGIAFKNKKEQRYIWLNSLGEEYTAEKIQAVISGKAVHRPRKLRSRYGDPQTVNLIIDIQEKLKAGKGPGYAHWAKIFNLKQMAKTIAYLSDNKIVDLVGLDNRGKELHRELRNLECQITALNAELKKMSDLKLHILNYAKTKNIFDCYRFGRYSSKYLQEHKQEIELHLAAKRAFDQIGKEKLPAIKQLNLQIESLHMRKGDVVKRLLEIKSILRKHLTVSGNLKAFLNSASTDKYHSENHFQ